MMKKYNFILFVFILASCTEKIDLKLDKQKYSHIVIDGMITDEYKKHKVVITRTVDYTSSEPPEKISGAIVLLSCENNTWQLQEISPGIYETIDSIKGEVGKTYKLKVIVENKEYTASCEMKPPMIIDSISIKEFPYGDPPNIPHYSIHLFAQDNPTRKNEYFIFKCYVNNTIWDTIRYWGFYSDEYYNGNYLYDELITILPLYENSNIVLESYSVPQDYFIYINNLFKNSQPELFFMGPPANVKGNISNNGLGYFLATSVRKSPSVFVNVK